MVKKNAGKSRGKTKATTTRKKAAKAADSGIEQVVELWQSALGRYATFASDVTKQISDGDLSLSRSINYYAKIWKGLATDLQHMADVMLKNASK